MRVQWSISKLGLASILWSLALVPWLPAQDTGATFQFDVPYLCRGGKTLTPRSCGMRGGYPEEMCTYDREISSGPLPSAVVRRSTLEKWLATCQAQPGKAKPAATPQAASTPARPAAAQAAPAATSTWPPRDLVEDPGPAPTPNWTTQATNPPYLAQFPHPVRVRAAMRGRDAVETSARQMGAFSQLNAMIKQLAGPRGLDLTRDENSLLSEYGAEWQWYQYKQNAPPPQEQARWGQLRTQYEKDPALREELLQKLFSSDFRNAYRAGTLVTKETQTAALDEINRPLREQEARRASGVVNPAPMSPREWARCLAVGNSENTCLRRLDEGTVLSESGRKVMDNLGGMFGLQEDKSEQVTPGLTLAGAYSGDGGLRLAFGGVAAASVRCGKVIAPAGYRVERQGNQLQVRLMAVQATGARLDKMLAAGYDASVSASADPERWQGQRVAISVRADGKLSGSGPVKVTGPVQVGWRDGTRTYYQGGVPVRSEPVREPIYENQTVTCALGVLTPTGKVSAVEAGARPEEMLAGIHGIGNVMDTMQEALSAKSLEELQNAPKTAAARDPDPGLRMQGHYAAQGGMDIEFLHTAAVVGCKQAAFPRDYKVAATASRIEVTIQNGAAPIALELKPDGTLVGSGAASLGGKILAGMNVNARPVFQQASETCSVGVLRPTGQ
jgi:hypothetical protein